MKFSIQMFMGTYLQTLAAHAHACDSLRNIDTLAVRASLQYRAYPGRSRSVHSKHMHVWTCSDTFKRSDDGQGFFLSVLPHVSCAGLNHVAMELRVRCAGALGGMGQAY